MNRNSRNRLRSQISRRDFLRLAGAAAGGAAFLSACGGSPPATEAPAAAAPTEAAPSVDKTLAFKGTLDIWDWEFAPRQAVVNDSIEAWTKMHPDIQIKYLPLPWTDMETKILTVAMAGNGPPMACVYYFWRYDLLRAGVIVPFAEDFVDWNNRLSTPFIRDKEGLPRALLSGWYTDMIYYNKEMFDKEGLKAEDIPKKWDDFIKLAQQLTQKDANGTITRVGCIMNDYWQHEYTWHGLVYQQGGWMFSEDGQRALWEEEPSVNALQFIQDWYHKHKIDSLDFPVGYGSFGNEMSPMLLGAGWNTGFMENDFPQIKGKWGTVSAPTLSGTPEPSWGLAMPEEHFQVFTNASDEAKAAGFEFIKFTMLEEERAVRWDIDTLVVPDDKKLLSDPRILEVPGIKSQAETMPWRVHTGERPIEAEKLWRTMFDKVTLEKGDVKAALKEATEAINLELPKKERFISERNYKVPA